MAAKVIFQRSIEKYKLRYTKVLSDGDSKMFKALLDLNVYGDTTIKKEECVNHVHKRMGTAIRKLLSAGKGQGVRLQGKGQGRLTGTTITKLGLYFTKAVCI